MIVSKKYCFYFYFNSHYNLKVRVHAEMKNVWVNTVIFGLKLGSRIRKDSYIMTFQWFNFVENLY